MALLEEIESLLTGVSNVTKGNMPKTPDDAVSIKHYGGPPQSLTGTFVNEPYFQILVRSAKYETGNTLCKTINDLIHGQKTTNVLLIQREGYIVDLGRDENNRNKFSMNYRCYYRE